MLKKIRLEKMAGRIFSMKDWEKTTIEEVKRRWGNRRREIGEVEKRKREIEEKTEIRKKKKEERRRRAIKERRCFVCGIFGHMACYCRNRREEKKGSTQMPLNKFEVLKDRVMQRGEGSGREIVKDRREILKEEKAKKERKTKVQKKDLGKKADEKKEEKIEIDEGQRRPEEKKEEKIEVEREVEMRGFSGGEILKGRYPLVWWKVRCYECGGLGHRKKDHRETKTMKKEKEKIEEDKKKDKKEIKNKKNKEKKTKEKKIERREIGIETEREEIVEEKREKKDIATEEDIVIEKINEKKEIELREREERVEKKEKEV